MSIDRATILRSPGKVTFGSAELFSASPITVTLETATTDIPVEGLGVVNRFATNHLVRIAFTPVEWADLTVLFPYAATAIGASIFGGTDSPAVVTPINGAALTVDNVAVTQMPTINLVAGQPIFGECVLTGILQNEGAASVLADYLSQASPATGATLTGLTRSGIISGQFSASFNSTTYYSGEGFTIGWDLTLEEENVDGLGVVDMKFGGLQATCTMRPVGVTEAAYAALFGFGRAIGSANSRYDLTISAAAEGGPRVMLADCEVQPGSYQYGSAVPRLGEITFVTARSETTGVLDALFTLDTASTE